jgi:phospholipid transport system substrate-binding protein
MLRSRLLMLLSTALLALSLAAPAAADPGAEAFVKAKQTELSGLLKKGKDPAAEKKLDGVFDQMLDYEMLAKESLGTHWDERSGDEKKEFQGILQRLVKNAYRKNLTKTIDYEVSFKGATKSKKGVLVKTVARSKKDAREEPISIDYVLHKVDGKWRIYDIVTEGSSLVNNYKSQFRRVIKQKGFAELMKRMKKKLDKEQA